MGNYFFIFLNSLTPLIGFLLYVYMHTLQSDLISVPVVEGLVELIQNRFSKNMLNATL